MFGLDVDTLRTVRECCDRVTPIDKALIYGSRAKGNYKTGSDIDITLLGRNLTLSNSVYQLYGLLEETTLPYKFDISIFAKLSDDNFIAHVMRVGKTLYEREAVLPKGWQVKSLGEVCEVTAGQSPEGKFYNKAGSGLPFYQGKKEFTQREQGSSATWTTKITKEAFAGDILMSVRAPVGPVNIAAQRVCIGRGLAAIKAGDKISRDYLFYFLYNNETELACSEGTVFTSVSKTQIEDIKIPLPPLEEQKRIAALLDEAFSGIAASQANLKKNIANMKDLFKSKLNQIFTEQGKGWKQKTIGEVCEVTAGQSPEGKFYNKAGNGLPFYQGKREFTRRDYFLCSNETESACSEGTVFTSISKTQIENIAIPVPSRSDRQRIVDQLDELESLIQSAIRIYERQLENFAELKKSLLQRAFNGMLTRK